MMVIAGNLREIVYALVVTGGCVMNGRCSCKFVTFKIKF